MRNETIMLGAAEVLAAFRGGSRIGNSPGVFILTGDNRENRGMSEASRWFALRFLCFLLLKNSHAINVVS